MTQEPLPGSQQDSVLSPGSVGGTTGKAVERKALVQPKDEEMPPPGVNWYEWNHRQLMPSTRSIKVEIDIKDMAKAIESYVLAGDVGSIMEIWKNVQVETKFHPEIAKINVRLMPS